MNYWKKIDSTIKRRDLQSYIQMYEKQMASDAVRNLDLKKAQALAEYYWDLRTLQELRECDYSFDADGIKGVIMHYNNNQHWRKFYSLFIGGYISKSAIGAGLAFAYTSSGATKAQALRVLKKSGTPVFDCDNAIAQYNALPDTITIYRGMFPSEYNDKWYWGLSWSTNLDIAKSFCERKKGIIAQTTIHKSQVLAYFNDMNESEILVDIPSSASVEKYN